MRGAPQPGFSRHILRIRSRVSRARTGRPGCPRRTFQVQNRRKPLRCQAKTVSGLTIASVECQPLQRRDRQTQSRRSTGVNFGRFFADLRSTPIWWRRAIFSSSRSTRARKSERRAARSVVRKVSIGGWNQERSIIPAGSDILRFSRSTIRQYLVELEQQNPTEEPVHQQDQVSTTDPDSTYATKGGTPARLGYYDNYLVDNHSCVIVGVQATAARMSQETVAAQDMIARFAEWQGRHPESVVADATYGNGEFLQWLMERNITPYMRTRDNALRKNNPLYGPERFTYRPENNSYLCPAGEPLNYVGLNVRNRAHAYIGSAKRCGACSQKAQCTTGRYKYLAIHMHEPARQRARDRWNTAAFASAQRKRKKVEALFAELKNLIGLRRLRLRRMKFVREQFFLAATAQNLKRLVRFLSQPKAHIVEATA